MITKQQGIELVKDFDTHITYLSQLIELEYSKSGNKYEYGLLVDTMDNVKSVLVDFAEKMNLEKTWVEKEKSSE